MLKTNLSLLAGFMVALLCARQSFAETSLNEELSSILREEGLTGMAWTIVDESGTAFPGAIGFRDAENREVFTRDTRFHVGSVTKSLLATGILRMATVGLVDLDQPATAYLPGLKFSNPWADTSSVTVRHLLDHTSGLNDAHLWQMFSERPNPDAPLIKAFPDPRVQLRIRARPGSRFSYSNMGYTLLGMIIETVAGERYESWLDKHLLIPLGMHDSTFTFTRQSGEHADPRLAWGHVDDGSRVEAKAVFLRPAAQFTTTSRDMAAFARFLLGDGYLDDRPFISEELMRARGQPENTQAAKNGLIAGYALGLGRRDRHGVIGICHSGNIIGFLAMLCIFPEERKAFAYSVNTDSETADYGRIDAALIQALEITPAQVPESTGSRDDIDQWHGRYILSPNRFQTFAYLDKVFGAIKISSAGGLLRMTSLQRSPRELRPVESRIYSAADRATASHVFFRGENGEFLLGDGFATYEKVSSPLLLAHWASVILGWAGLAWLWAAGVISLIRKRGAMLRKTEAPAFLAILALVIPVPFFLKQSFMELGDLTIASALLAAVTLLLPIGMLFTLVRGARLQAKSVIDRMSIVAASFVLQWCAVLAWAKMLPLRLWV